MLPGPYFTHLEVKSMLRFYGPAIAAINGARKNQHRPKMFNSWNKNLTLRKISQKNRNGASEDEAREIEHAVGSAALGFMRYIIDSQTHRTPQLDQHRIEFNAITNTVPTLKTKYSCQSQLER